MKNEVITLVVKPLTIEVVDGKVAHSRLWYQAPGLDIYVGGAVPLKREHSVHFLAVQNAIARHIPAIALRCVRRLPDGVVKTAPEQKRLF